MATFNSVIQSNDKTMIQVAVLLTRYGFDLGGLSPLEVIDKWLTSYSAHWIRLAIVEALYQGRYKAVSIEQILRLWQRRSRVTFHFNHEFERLICRHLLLEHSTPTNNQPQSSLKNLQHHIADEQDSVETSLILDHTIKTPESSQVSLPIPRENAPKIFNDRHPSSVSPLTKIDSEPDPSDHKPSVSYQTPLMLTDGKTPSSIHQFVPYADDSHLYTKLRAVLHQRLVE
ncbi:conserved hypothetical protein [Rippkaea orientalis PCC 8801]|uniref:Uncharacterized protein n=1 Tax=Rippkaea orientalis (strain PCC 8801 / RF-1) TaxID=41431 RepID=B7JZK9_RIPO1|nr:hypothetical protein [Rippkaea orientalis]ACK64952.1 conserved hypothetical protein [Rippkaea orientalis PCC 8801]